MQVALNHINIEYATSAHACKQSCDPNHRDYYTNPLPQSMIPAPYLMLRVYTNEGVGRGRGVYGRNRLMFAIVGEFSHMSYDLGALTIFRRLSSIV